MNTKQKCTDQLSSRIRSFKEVHGKVKKLGGWIDGDCFRFPSVEIKEAFEKWLNER